jgi:hypothetical protein
LEQWTPGLDSHQQYKNYQRYSTVCSSGFAHAHTHTGWIGFAHANASQWNRFADANAARRSDPVTERNRFAGHCYWSRFARP